MVERKPPSSAPRGDGRIARGVAWTQARAFRLDNWRRGAAHAHADVAPLRGAPRVFALLLGGIVTWLPIAMVVYLVIRLL